VDFDVKMPSRMSVTLGRKLDVCPRDAALYLHFRGQASAAPLLRGSVSHTVFERIMGTLIAQGEESLFAPQPGEDPVLAAQEVAQTTKEWVDEIVAELGVPLSEKEIDEVRVMAYHMAVGNRVRPQDVVALEKTMVLELDGGGLLIGKVDVAALEASGILDVNDYKTSFYAPTSEELEGQLQVPWYAVLLLWGRPLNEDGTLGEPLGLEQYVSWVRCSQIYPRFLNKNTGLMSERQIPSPSGQELWGLADLRDKGVAAQRAWDRLRHGVETREWPAKSGSHCSECTARSLCPIPGALRRFGGEVDTIEQAREAMEWAVRQEAYVRATKEEVKNFAKVNGLAELEVGTDRYGFVVSHPRSVRKKGRSADWEGLQVAVERAAELGEEFDVFDWLQAKPKTEFKKLKPAKDEAA
jgi:RecB family exonuclease